MIEKRIQITSVVGKNGLIMLPEKIKQFTGLQQGEKLKIEVLPDGNILIKVGDQ